MYWTLLAGSYFLDNKTKHFQSETVTLMTFLFGEFSESKDNIILNHLILMTTPAN